MRETQLHILRDGAKSWCLFTSLLEIKDACLAGCKGKSTWALLEVSLSVVFFKAHGLLLPVLAKVDLVIDFDREPSVPVSMMYLNMYHVRQVLGGLGDDRDELSAACVTHEGKHKIVLVCDLDHHSSVLSLANGKASNA